ncbi:MAG: hypothetical protein JSV81_00335 [Anaerolineales bacterium]|nr:MAG: hypothetical protein JSV81_00335 [Anaerolineales bacterium]
MSHMRALILTVILLGAFLAAPNAYAHRPEQGNPDGVTLIPSPTTSYAYYQEIQEPGQLHVYQFEGQAGQFFHAGINIPQLNGLEDYGVSLALLGPGLPPLPEDQLPLRAADDGHDHHHSPLQVFPDLHLDSAGGLVAESRKSEDFHEPFTQTNYWGRQAIDLDLPQSGTYYLLIWNPDGDVGKYVLDTGTEEVFGSADLFRFPLWWLNTRLYFEQAPQIIGVVALLVSALFGWVLYRRRRKTTAERPAGEKGRLPQSMAEQQP